MPTDPRFGFPTAYYPGTTPNLPAFLLRVIRSLGTPTLSDDFISLEICLVWLVKLVKREEERQQVLADGGLMSIIGIVRDIAFKIQIPTYGLQILAQLWKTNQEVVFSEGGDLLLTKLETLPFSQSSMAEDPFSGAYMEAATELQILFTDPCRPLASLHIGRTIRCAYGFLI